MCCVNGNIILIHFKVAFLACRIPRDPRYVLKANVSVNIPVLYSDIPQVLCIFNTMRYSQAKPLLLGFFEGAVVFGDGWWNILPPEQYEEIALHQCGRVPSQIHPGLQEPATELRNLVPEESHCFLWHEYPRILWTLLSWEQSRYPVHWIGSIRCPLG